MGAGGGVSGRHVGRGALGSGCQGVGLGTGGDVGKYRDVLGRYVELERSGTACHVTRGERDGLVAWGGYGLSRRPGLGRSGLACRARYRGGVACRHGRDRGGLGVGSRNGVECDGRALSAGSDRVVSASRHGDVKAREAMRRAGLSGRVCAGCIQVCRRGWCCFGVSGRTERSGPGVSDGAGRSGWACRHGMASGDGACHAGSRGQACRIWTGRGGVVSGWSRWSGTRGYVGRV